jgi:phosphoserine phosphatase RsbX
MVTPKPVADLLDIGVAQRTLPGERESGDACVVASFEAGMLVAVIDGLGHGPDAAHAAGLARLELEATPRADVVTLVERCHAALRHSRGAVMTLVQLRLPGPTMTWLAVGNVEGRLIRSLTRTEGERGANEAVLLMGGVVGYQLPRLKPATLPFRSGDALILATDGLHSGAFESMLDDSASAQDQAESLLTTHGRATDDALVVVVRYRG